MVKASRSAHIGQAQWPSGISHYNGFRLLGTPLGFQSNPKAKLLFYSHPDSGPLSRNKRILTSTFAAAVMGAERRSLDTLVLNFHRKIRLGKLDLELWPSGLGPGGAQLLIGLKNLSILYCDGIRLVTPEFGPHAEVPKCDILLIDFTPSEPRPPSPKNSLQRIGTWTDSRIQAGKTPVLATETFNSAAEVIWHLRGREHNLRAVRTYFDKARRSAPLGLDTSNLRRLEQSLPHRSVVLHRARLFEKSSLFAHNLVDVAYVGPKHLTPPWAPTSFRLSEPEDRTGLIKYVAQTGASAVALGPRCDDATAALLVKKGFQVFRVLPPEQIPLPLPSTA